MHHTMGPLLFFVGREIRILLCFRSVTAVTLPPCIVVLSVMPSGMGPGWAGARGTAQPLPCWCLTLSNCRQSTCSSLMPGTTDYSLLLSTALSQASRSPSCHRVLWKALLKMRCRAAGLLMTIDWGHPCYRTFIFFQAHDST